MNHWINFLCSYFQTNRNLCIFYRFLLFLLRIIFIFLPKKVETLIWREQYRDPKQVLEIEIKSIEFNLKRYPLEAIALLKQLPS